MEIQEVSHVNESLIQELSRNLGKICKGDPSLFNRSRYRKNFKLFTRCIRFVFPIPAIAKLEQNPIGFVGVENNRNRNAFLVTRRTRKRIWKTIAELRHPSIPCDKTYV